jgi:hypothetical protein
VSRSASSWRRTAAQDGEPQTERRESLRKQAEHRLKVAYSRLNGSMIGEARRRLEVR